MIESLKQGHLKGNHEDDNTKIFATYRLQKHNLFGILVMSACGLGHMSKNVCGE